MKFRVISAVLASVIVWALLFSAAASAQAQTGECTADLALSPAHGTAGSNFTASMFFGSTAWISSGVSFYWDQIDAAHYLGAGSWPSSVQTGYTSVAQLTVPSGASVTWHKVLAAWTWKSGNFCSYGGFTVDPASVQQNAYGSASAPVSSLPSTGFFLLIPAAGLGIGGLGGAMLRRRRSRAGD